MDKKTLKKNQKKYHIQTKKLGIEDYTIETFRDDVEGFEELSKIAILKFHNEVDYFKKELQRYEKLHNLAKDIQLSRKLLLRKWGEHLEKEKSFLI